MAVKKPSLLKVWFTFLLAAFFWLIIFYLQVFNFWVSMAVALPLLAGLGWFSQGSFFSKMEFNRKNIITGIIMALVLYGVFWAGNYLSRFFFSFAGAEIAAIYVHRAEAPLWLITLLLFFLIGPCEELYWRGFVQHQLSQHFGLRLGCFLAAILYTSVHFWSGNLILVLAALVLGLIWGWLYRATGSVVPGIISHGLWDLMAFVWFPVG